MQAHGAQWSVLGRLGRWRIALVALLCNSVCIHVLLHTHVIFNSTLHDTRFLHYSVTGVEIGVT